MENSVIELHKTTEENTPELKVIQDIQTIKEEYFTQWLDYAKFRAHSAFPVRR